MSTGGAGGQGGWYLNRGGQSRGRGGGRGRGQGYRGQGTFSGFASVNDNTGRRAESAPPGTRGGAQKKEAPKIRVYEPSDADASSGKPSQPGNTTNSEDPTECQDTAESKNADRFEAITTFENEQLVLDISSLSMEEKFPRRPGYLKGGNSVRLFTNYFELGLKNADQRYFRYDVAFSGLDLSKVKRQRYMEMFIEQLNRHIDNVIAANHEKAKVSEAKPEGNKAYIATDYSSIIITTSPLEQYHSTPSPWKFRIVLHHRLEEPFPPETHNDTEELRQARARKMVSIEVTFKSSYAVRELFNFVNGRNTSYADKEEVIQALNIVFQHAPNSKLNISNAGKNDMYPFRDKYVPPHPQVNVRDIGQGLIAHRGYFSSVRLGPTRILLNIQPQTRAMYQAGPMMELISNFIGRTQSPGYSALNTLSKFLKGIRVVTEYTGTKKVSTVFGLVKKPYLGAKASVVRFRPDLHDKEISVRDYFHSTYQCNVGDDWVVNCGTDTNPRYVPVSLCTVYGGQPARRLLNERQTAEILRHAARPPYENAKSIVEQGLKILSIDTAAQAESINCFGIEMKPNLLTVPGKILNAPMLRWATRKTIPQNGAWNLRDVKSFKRINVGKFSILRLMQNGSNAPNVNLQAVGNFLAAEFTKYDLYTSGCRYFSTNPRLNFDKVSSVANDMVSDLSTAKLAKDRFVLICIPRRDTKLYALIKKIGDVDVGIHTIVIVEANMLKLTPPRQDRGLAANIALKVCAKSGGLFWGLNPDDLRPFDANTMLVGIDVTHPSPGSRRTAPSVAAVCASYDAHLTGYSGEVAMQTARVEMVEGLEELLVRRLTLFHVKNQRYPWRIIVYRDGVSEGQYPIVLSTEYPAMKRAFYRVYGDESKHPKATIIVVGKRHHTRFYPTSTTDADRTSNTRPGTAVDRHITGYGENIWDFYLQPHAALQGTAKPMHCVVIKDEGGHGVELATMTHSLCYLWHRATKAVSIPPPAYYADKLAERARAYLHNLFADDGSDTASQADSSSVLSDWDARVHPDIKDSMFYI